MAKIVLVTGGVRSGKSTFAEKYAAQLGKKIAYIATAQVYDEEMYQRVRLHKARRPSAWKTYEAPYHAAKTLRKAAVEHDTILFDCLTVYISNQLLQTNGASAEERAANVINDIEDLLIAAKEVSANVIFVTNEVGCGIVPENALAREYRDLAGRINQRFAQIADEVYLVISSLPVEIKKLAVHLDTAADNG